MNKEIPDFNPGDTVIVSVNVVEGSRKRVQAYEGVVIAKRNRGLNSGFIVRKISNGEGVERTFQTYSPLIAKIEVKRRGDVRRARAVLPAWSDWQESPHQRKSCPAQSGCGRRSPCCCGVSAAPPAQRGTWDWTKAATVLLWRLFCFAMSSPLLPRFSAPCRHSIVRPPASTDFWTR